MPDRSVTQIEPAAPDSPAAEAILRTYMADIAGRYAEHWFAKALPAGQEPAGVAVPSSSPRM